MTTETSKKKELKSQLSFIDTENGLFLRDYELEDFIKVFQEKYLVNKCKCKLDEEEVCDCKNCLKCQETDYKSVDSGSDAPKYPKGAYNGEGSIYKPQTSQVKKSRPDINKKGCGRWFNDEYDLAIQCDQFYKCPSCSKEREH